MATSLDLISYTQPDAELFKIVHGSFSAVGDALVGIHLSAASARVDKRWSAASYQVAIMLLAAHNLTMSGEPALSVTTASGQPASATPSGDAKKVKTDDMEIEFSDSGKMGMAGGLKDAGDGDELNMTSYGRQYKSLRKRNVGAGRVVR